MSERAAYSRVYWSIIDDEKFVTIYDDNHHLATWLRLLIAADQAWPASANLPVNVRKTSVTALCAAGLVDVTGPRYRIRGLDAERNKRKEWATTRGASADRTVTERSPSGVQTQGLRLDETRLDKTSIAREDGLPHITPEAQRLIEGLTGKLITTAGDKQLTEYDRQLEAHGLAKVNDAYRRVAGSVKNPTYRQLVWSALRVLEPFTTPQDIAKVEAASSSRAAVDRTQRMLRELRGETA